MTGLRLHHSNRMEALTAEFVRILRADPGDPLAPERIVVAHLTIERWLSLELARGLGVAANLRFEQPAKFAWSIMRSVVPTLSRDQPYEPARLRWRIHDLLSESVGETEKGAARGGREDRGRSASAPCGAARGWEDAVRGYLRDGDPRKRLDLADRLARAYDQCLLYRPDWIREWEEGAAAHWQARLWQRVVDLDGPEGARHWVAALDEFRASFRVACGARDTIGDPPSRTADPSSGRAAAGSRHPGSSASSDPAGGTPRPPGWPRRVTFFAVPALSPSYLEMLTEAARGIEIHLFLLDPCREYWGDIHSRREIDHRAGGDDPEVRYLTEGNELLAAWGRAGRDTIDALVEAASAQWEDRFVEPAGSRRLAAVQRDILDLRLADEAARDDASRAGGIGDGGSGAATVARAQDGTTPPAESSGGYPRAPRRPAADDSIQIHVCHSPVREAEVLHDRLLALFDTHRDLEPADVLVLTPDLEVYGPAIEAVFAAAGRIPCDVARARAAQSRTLRGYLELLALPGSRYSAEAVLAPLAAPAVRVRFGIGEDDLPAIRAAVGEAGIRWGVDEAHRRREDLPETGEHTWRWGLRRLLLGYAMADAHAPVAGLVPCRAAGDSFVAGAIEGELLGRFASYCEAAFGLRARLAGISPPAQWGKVLRDVAGVFLADGSEPAPGAGVGANRPLLRELAAEAGAVRALIRDFEREAARAEAPVPFEVVLDVLGERARETGAAAARLADGVTVASLGTGRIFPAEVVCLVGMNDGVFPRSPSIHSFDVIAAGAARRGDRDIRYEDRFAFLEALLAARCCLLVTYAGRGLRDDAPIPPSVLVDELKDYLDRRFPDATLETLHPLQPFSPRYFASPPCAGPAPGTAPAGVRSGDDLVSYSRGMCAAAKTMLEGLSGSGSANRFTEAVLPELDTSRRRVDVAELAAFFANPTRFLLRERLGVRLELDALALDDEEPFELDGLEHFRLRSDIWDHMRAGVEPERSAVLLHGSGRLPQAGLGHILHARARSEVEPLDGLLTAFREAIDAPPRAVDFEIDGFRVVGTHRHVACIEPAGGKSVPAGNADADVGGPARMVWWRIGRLRARDRIDIWLRQLAWAAAGHRPLGAVVMFFHEGSWKTAEYPPPDEPREQLGRWLRAWWQGLAAPLPFFSETSFAFAGSIARSAGGGDSALETARGRALEAWFGAWNRPGERADVYVSLVHDGDDPLTGAFEELATELLVPLARAQR